MSRSALTVHVLLVFAVSRHGRKGSSTCGVRSPRPATEALTALCQDFVSIAKVNAYGIGRTIAIRLKKNEDISRVLCLEACRQAAIDKESG